MNIKSIPKYNLDNFFQWFYAELTKKNEEDYDPESLHMINR